MIGLAQILVVLRKLGEARPGVEPIVRIKRGDQRFDWRELCGCSDGGFPSLHVGQHRDCRFRTERRDGLHIHVFLDRLEIHLDRIDPIKDPIGHLVADTAMVEDMLKGAGIGLLLALMADEPKLIAVGATLGAAAGASRAARPRQIIPLESLL